MAFAFGQMVGPVIGGKLTDVHGYRNTCDIMAVTCMIGTVAFFCVIFVPDLVCGKKSARSASTSRENLDPEAVKVVSGDNIEKAVQNDLNNSQA
jgi:hypothetical protein